MERVDESSALLSQDHTRVHRAEALPYGSVDPLLVTIDDLSSSKAKPMGEREVHEVEVSPPQVKFQAYKVNRILFGVLLVLGIVPGLLYLGIVKLLNRSHPFEALDRSLTDMQSHSFKVGSRSESSKTREGAPLIQDQIQHESRKQIASSGGKSFEVLRQAKEKFESGFICLQLFGLDGKPVSENRGLVRSMAQRDGISLRIAVSSHQFLSAETKRRLLNEGDQAIYEFDQAISDAFQDLLSDAGNSTADDYKRALGSLEGIDPEKISQIEGHIDYYFRTIENPRARHYAILDDLQVEPVLEHLKMPAQQGINDSTLGVIANWAGMSVEEAFGNLDVSNPVSVFQVLLTQHFLSPLNGQEIKLATQAIIKGGAEKIDRKDTVIQLLPPKDGKARLTVKWKYELTMDGEVRQYEIREIIEIKKGKKAGSPAQIEITRVGKRIN